MDMQATLMALLEQYKFPILFVDTEHVIRYANEAARSQFSVETAEGLVGSSLFDCHNPRSRQMILEYYELLLQGKDELFIQENSKGQLVHMVSVRDSSGDLLGYYERYEDLKPTR